MKSFLITILCATSLVSAAPAKQENIPANLIAAMSTSTPDKKTNVVVINSIGDLHCLIDLPEESTEKFKNDLSTVATRVNGELINPGESKEISAGSMIVVSIELPAKSCCELLQKTNIFTRIAFSTLAWTTRLKVVFLVPVDPEETEIDLLQHLVTQIEKWETKNPNIKVNFRSPLGFLLTLS